MSLENYSKMEKVGEGEFLLPHRCPLPNFQVKST